MWTTCFAQIRPASWLTDWTTAHCVAHGYGCAATHGVARKLGCRRHALLRRLKDIPGSSVEHNNFCVSAHFRNCPGECWQDVVSAVEEIVEGHDDLRMTRGRKVVEVRPKVRCLLVLVHGTALQAPFRRMADRGWQAVPCRSASMRQRSSSCLPL